MRWPLFFPLTFLIGLALMLARPAISYPVAVPEILLLVAFHTALHVRRAYAPAVFWWCGLMQDAFLGERLGANALIFFLAGCALQFFHGKVLERHLLTRVVLVFGLALAVLAFRPLLAEWRLPFASLEDARLRFTAAFWTALLGPVAGLLMYMPFLRTWREEPVTYGLPGGR